MSDAGQPDPAARAARAEALTAELLAKEGYVTGATRFPRKLGRDEAAELVAELAAQVDRGSTARAETAARQHLPIVCSRGCNGCCEELILVYQPEAAAAVRWLLLPENSAARERFLAAFPAWQKAVGDAPARMAERVARGDHAGFVALHQAQWRRGTLCALNHDGDCVIYPVRPLACRNAHAVETHRRCSAASSDGKPAARLEFETLDTYLQGASQVLRAAHHATGGERNRPMALCEAIFRLLQSELAAERKRARTASTPQKPPGSSG